MHNNDTEVCKICRKYSGDNNKDVECYAHSANSCLSKDRAMIMLLYNLLEKE